MKYVIATALLFVSTTAWADSEPPSHLFDDLNANGTSDSAEVVASSDTEPTREIDDPIQPVDDGSAPSSEGQPEESPS